MTADQNVSQPNWGLAPVRLRHGIFLAPHHPMGDSPTLLLQQDLELFRIVEELGFHEAYVGEHHSAGWEIIGSPEVFLAAAAERTKRIKLGTGVVSVPYHNPLMVAERIVQLDHQTQGRIIFGMGPGLLGSDARMLRLDPMDQRERLALGVDVILRLLKGETVTEKTDWYDLRDARLHLAPYSYPHPEVVVTSAVTPSGARLAGKYDLGMLCVAAALDAKSFDALGVNWRTANDVAAEHGRVMDPRRLRLVLRMHLAETREKAIEQVRLNLPGYINYMNNNAVGRIDVPDGVDPVEWYAGESGVVVIGTPDDAIAQIEEYYKKFPVIGAILLQANSWASWEDRKRSYELYARHVMPYFEKANVSRVESYKWVGEHNEELTQKRKAAARAMFDKHEAELAKKGEVAARPLPGNESTFG